MTPIMVVDPEDQYYDPIKEEIRLIQFEDTNKKEYKNINSIETIDVENLLLSIITRKRFTYNLKTVFLYFFKCFCLRNIDRNKRLSHFKKHFLFHKAEDKLMHEIDIITLVKQQRKFKLLA